MSTVKKKKIKIKKKNFAIFIIVIILLIYSFGQIIFLTIKLISSEDKPIQVEKSPKKEKKELTEEEKKLQILNNINEEITYFNKDFLDRYIQYKENHSTLSDEQIIKDVNMNLDILPYENTKEAQNINTEKVLVNKHYHLSEDFVPDNLITINQQYALSDMKLVEVAAKAFESMAKNAKKEKLNIVAMSSYRSYEYQVNLYNRYKKEDGQEKADTYSGRPGYSEHQTGLAVDVYNNVENYTNFEKTKEYTWMQEHAHEYGFILRFPKEKEQETGYQFESWHYRYVGAEAATYIKENNISFEEYYATIIKDW